MVWAICCIVNTHQYIHSHTLTLTLTLPFIGKTTFILKRQIHGARCGNRNIGVLNIQIRLSKWKYMATCPAYVCRFLQFNAFVCMQSKPIIYPNYLWWIDLFWWAIEMNNYVNRFLYALNELVDVLRKEFSVTTIELYWSIFPKIFCFLLLFGIFSDAIYSELKLMRRTNMKLVCWLDYVRTFFR